MFIGLYVPSPSFLSGFNTLQRTGDADLRF